MEIAVRLPPPFQCDLMEELTVFSLKHRTNLEEYTVGRSTFRIHPTSATENGVDKDLTKDGLCQILKNHRQRYANIK